MLWVGPDATSGSGNGGGIGLLAGLPVQVVSHTQIYPGYDNLVARRPAVGRYLRRVTYALEQTPLRVFGLSHLLVIEKVAPKEQIVGQTTA